MRRYAAVTVTVTATVMLAGCQSAGEPAPSAVDVASQAATTQTARPIDPVPAVGAIFLGATDTHTCTGAVVHSSTGNLILTAAHCLAAEYPAEFVPAFTGQADRADTWTVDTVYLDPRWVANQDPMADYAFASVHRASGGSIEAVGRAAYSLGRLPSTPADVTVVGYPMGVGGGPIGCDTTTDKGRDGYPSLQCGGFVDGTSGAPIVAGATVFGVIGGLDRGGCDDEVSYSSPFDDKTLALLARAEAGGPGDIPPAAFEDDC